MDLKLRRGSPLIFPHWSPCLHGSWHSPSSHPNSTEPSPRSNPPFCLLARSSVIALLRGASGSTDPRWYGLEQFTAFPASLLLWDRSYYYFCFTDWELGCSLPRAWRRGGGHSPIPAAWLQRLALPAMPDSQPAAWRIEQKDLARLGLGLQRPQIQRWDPPPLRFHLKRSCVTCAAVEGSNLGGWPPFPLPLAWAGRQPMQQVLWAVAGGPRVRREWLIMDTL